MGTGGSRLEDVSRLYCRSVVSLTGALTVGALTVGAGLLRWAAGSCWYCWLSSSTAGVLGVDWTRRREDCRWLYRWVPLASEGVFWYWTGEAR